MHTVICTNRTVIKRYHRRSIVTTFRPSQDVSNVISWTRMYRFLLRFHWSLLPMGSVKYVSALVQIMTWHRPCNRPLTEPMMVIFLTHMCITWPLLLNNRTMLIRRRLQNYCKHFGEKHSLSSLYNSRGAFFVNLFQTYAFTKNDNQYHMKRTSKPIFKGCIQIIIWDDTYIYIYVYIWYIYDIYI